MSDLAAVVERARLVVTCGPGGVGKTTTAAALGVLAARSGRRVIVVTVDPARRLADALGIEAAEEGAAPVPVEVTGAGAGGGSMHALMLDASATFDELVREESPSAERAEAILRNPVYRSITRALAGAQEYMAIERLHQLHTAGEHDLVVVDTPPSRHALDLLEAPDRLTSFLGHPIYRTLTAPSRTFARVANAASSAFLWTVKRLAGPTLVQDTVEFFRSISALEAGLRRRASEVAELLRDDATSFVLVSSPRAEALDEAAFLLDALRERRFPLGAVVVNLVHPLPPTLEPFDVLSRLDAGPLADQVAQHRSLTQLALAERAELAVLAEGAGDAPVVRVPLLSHDVHDLDGLAEVAALLADARHT
jgi:anion-transporting  ArsA/GET3 family ATPase